MTIRVERRVRPASEEVELVPKHAFGGVDRPADAIRRRARAAFPLRRR